MGRLISEKYAAWQAECEERFQQLKKNEEELNRIFIDIYGLQDELTPDVADKDVTVHRVFDSKDDVPESMKGSNYVRTMRDEIVSLISYAVGCMFGRYSLDVDGLAYAGGEWEASKYKTIIPDRDNIIPICYDEYFDDDITGRFVEFVRKVYGDDTLEENLKFIADALGGKGTPREVIRSYFLNDFYADHLKTYQKRPIYWLFDSGKKNGFKALCYMHRYQRDLLARLRTDYVHEQQERYRTQLAQLGDAIDHASASERVKLTKQQKKFQDQATELQKYEEKVHHLADQNIEIDLDDGVKHILVGQIQQHAVLGHFLIAGIGGIVGQDLGQLVGSRTGLQHGGGVRHLGLLHVDVRVFFLELGNQSIQNVNHFGLDIEELQMNLFAALGKSGNAGEHQHCTENQSKYLFHIPCPPVII